MEETMAVTYSIGPTIGTARLGNSLNDFYLEPVTIGGLPVACDEFGNATMEDGAPVFERTFKDGDGKIKRQGAVFRVYEITDGVTYRELTLDDVRSIVWTVHLANKKSCWYEFKGLDGNLLYGDGNSYEAMNVPLRNKTVTGAGARRALIIDPGPRSLEGRDRSIEIGKDNSGSYEFASWPPSNPTYGDAITSLGTLRTDNAGRLIVLGGYGKSGGDTEIESFGGGDTWYDDISDGPVTCAVTLNDGTSVKLEAWCIVGSPKFAPEIVNIVTLDDTMYDAAVRNLGADPAIYAGGSFNTSYRPNYQRDILPILTRPGTYRWVANTPSMSSMSPPPFDARDASAATHDLRLAYLALFRAPSPQSSIGEAANILFDDHGFPMMPLNSGSNSVFNQPGLIDKFLTLTETQYFFLQQWAAGHFDHTPPPPSNPIASLTAASTGNSVGGPFCPGIEVTWSTRNPNIYSGLMEIRSRHDAAYYESNGLSPSEDETAAPLGCEPGDLTKRMAIPWQADFYQCTMQYINFTDPTVNKEGGIPKPPTYYAYWWPPQSPWDVIAGDLTVEEQALTETPAGQQVLFSRGIDSFGQMIDRWYYMGFIVNQNISQYGRLFPYFTEQERNNAGFAANPPPQPQPKSAEAVTATSAGAGHRPAGAAVRFGWSRRQGRQGR
jgi:hypothetical protein